MNVIRLLFLLLLSTLFIQCDTKEKIDLSLNLKAGNTFKFRFELYSQSTNDIKIHYIHEYKFKVESVENDTLYHFLITPLKLMVDTKMFGEREYYDSSKEPQRMSKKQRELYEEYSPFMETKFMASVNNKNQVIQEAYPDRYISSDINFVELHQFFIPFSKNIIKIGTQWEDKGVIELLDNGFVHTYQVKEITPSTVNITVKRVHEGVPGLIKEIVSEGNYIIDRSTGLMNYGKIKLNHMQGGSSSIVIRRF
jgi:hypothetical protein